MLPVNVEQDDLTLIASLQQHFSQSCAEKCKLLSAIENSNREGRALQKEIHRLLDFLAEIVPDDYISSEEEEDGEDFVGEDNWFYESDEEVSISEIGRESRKCEDLKTRILLLKTTTSQVPRRRSLSPDRTTKSLKTKRNYRHLPLLPDGQVNLPVYLGRGIHRTILLQTGEVEEGENFQKNGFVFPIGYQIKRKYFTFDADITLDKAKKIFYYCSIRKVDEAPLFEILIDSNESNSAAAAIGGGNNTEDGDQQEISIISNHQIDVLDSDSHLDVLYGRFKEKFTEPVRNQLQIDFASGESFFGFEHESLARYLKDLAANLTGKVKTEE